MTGYELKKLPVSHVRDWKARCADDEDWHVKVIEQNNRYIYLEMDDAAWNDLVSDTKFYANDEGGFIDAGSRAYVMAARRLLAYMEKHKMI
jgi:hypothetical protein